MTLLPHSHTCVFRMADASKSVAELAELLKAYIARSKKTQRQIAEEAGVPNPSYLSHMANGRVNWVESDYFRPIATALGLKTHEIAELKPDLIVTERPLTDAERRAEGAIFPAAPFEQSDELYLPEGLREAIETFGDLPKYAALRDPTVQRQVALGRRFDGGPETAEEWLTFYTSNKQWFDSKKGN